MGDCVCSIVAVTLSGTDPAEVQRCFDVNVAAPLRLAQIWAQGRVQHKLGGAVVNVSSQLLGQESRFGPPKIRRKLGGCYLLGLGDLLGRV